MSNDDLDKLLKSARVPERPPAVWEELPKRVVAKLHWRANRTAEETALPPRRWWPLSLGLSAAACLVIGFVVGNWRGREQAGVLQNEKVVREVLAMFPNQVQAITQDENGLHLSLAERADIPASTPLWIKVCDGRACRSLVTFSGQVVQIAGQRVEVLADAQGGVLLVGDHFFWTSQQPAPRDHLRIEARSLDQYL